jgi:FkbM family methyltransferase
MKTIFDIGMHEGWDSEFYLRKGFRVVAVEANPQFLPAVRQRLQPFLESRQLTIVNKVISREGGHTIPFYVRPDKNGWSSIYRDVAERDGQASAMIDIGSVTVPELYAEHGIPHFIKCDIEGADEIVAEQLAAEPRKPAYASFEVDGADDRIVGLLAGAGYDRFQLVNQGYLPRYRPPNPAREGSYVDQRFDGRMSGLFGAELDPAFWADVAVTRRRLGRWRALHDGKTWALTRYLARRYGKFTLRTWLIGRGWIDLHARHGAA